MKPLDRKYFTHRNLTLVFLLGLAYFTIGITSAATIFESATLGTTGLPQGTVAATNVTPNVYVGVRFQLTQPVVTSQVGGHFVSAFDGTFFGAIVELDDANDFPDSGDLSTGDVLGSTTLSFPKLSDEVFGDLALTLDPGWYALVFGSGLFGTNGDGATPLTNPDIGSQQYIAFQPGASIGWGNLINPLFRNFRFAVEGHVVPEPSTIAYAVSAVICSILIKKSYLR